MFCLLKLKVEHIRGRDRNPITSSHEVDVLLPLYFDIKEQHRHINSNIYSEKQSKRKAEDND